MKFFKTTILAMMLSAPLAAIAADVADPGMDSADLAIESAIEGIQPYAGSDEPFRIEYMLDSEGRPYIISIWSNDADITRMIRKMIGGETDMNSTGDPSLAISFYYNNIR